MVVKACDLTATKNNIHVHMEGVVVKACDVTATKNNIHVHMEGRGFDLKLQVRATHCYAYRPTREHSAAPW